MPDGLLLTAATEHDDRDAVCRLHFWRRLAGLEADVPHDATGPYALGLSGHWQEAADGWREQSCPYETALALSRTGDVGSLRWAHAELQRLGARPPRDRGRPGAARAGRP